MIGKSPFHLSTIEQSSPIIVPSSHRRRLEQELTNRLIDWEMIPNFSITLPLFCYGRLSDPILLADDNLLPG